MSTRDGLLVRIGDRRYVTDTEQINWETVEVTRRGVDQSAQDGEVSLSNRVTWRRVRDNWVGGEGQEYADLTDEDESSSLRYNTGVGVDPWDRRCLKIRTHDRWIEDYTSATGHLFTKVMSTASENLLVVHDNEVDTWDVDPINDSHSQISTNDFAPDTIQHVEVLGNDTVYVQLGSDIQSKEFPGGSWAQFSTVDTDFLADVKTRLLAGKDNELFEILGNGKKRSIYVDCTRNNLTWGGVVPAPGGIYAWGDDAIVSEVWRLPLDEATGSISAPRSVARLPIGERVTTMLEYLGVILIGTTLGLRVALVQGDGSLQVGGLIDEIGEVSDLVGAKEYVFVSSTSAKPLWRVDLSRFTNSDSLIPAFSYEEPSVQSGTDATAVMGHSVDSITSLVDGTTVGVVSLGDRGVSVNTIEEQSWAQTYDRVSTLDLGWFTFGIGEPKSLDTIVVEVDDIGGVETAASVKVEVFSSAGSVLDNTEVLASGTTTYTWEPSPDTRADAFRVQLTLTAGNTAGPVVRRVTVRAVPVPFMSDEIQLPLILTDQVAGENGQVFALDVWNEFQYLLGLRDTRQRVTLEVGDYSATARVESVEVVRGGLGGGNGLDGWDVETDFMSGTWRVKLVTVDSGAAGGGVSDFYGGGYE